MLGIPWHYLPIHLALYDTPIISQLWQVMGSRDDAWWEHSPPTNVAVVWSPDLVSHVGWVSFLLQWFFSGCSILSATQNQQSKFQFELESVDKEPLHGCVIAKFYLFIYLCIYFIIYSGKFTYMYITCSWRWTQVVVKSCKMWFTYIGFPINNFVYYSFHLNRHVPSKIMKVLSTLKAASLALVNTILPWWWQNLLALSRNHLSWWVLDGTCSYSILESQIYSMHMVGQAKVKGVLSFAKMEKRKNQN